jgi:hypothetical protein
VSSNSESAIQASHHHAAQLSGLGERHLQDHALAGQQGLAGSDVALGLGDPKPRFVDAGHKFITAVPSLWP